MVKAVCKRCQHRWNYSGGRTHYCSCPNCKTSVFVGFFVEKEKTDLQIRDAQITRLNEVIDEQIDKFEKLQDYINHKNPLLFQEWLDNKKKMAEQEAEAILDAKIENGEDNNHTGVETAPVPNTQKKRALKKLEGEK